MFYNSLFFLQILSHHLGTVEAEKVPINIIVVGAVWWWGHQLEDVKVRVNTHQDMEILPYCVCCCVRGITQSFQLCSVSSKNKVG